MSSHLLTVATLAGLALAGSASASITFTIDQVGSNVVVTGAGSINTTGMTVATLTGWSPPSVGSVSVEVGSGLVTGYGGLSGPALGPGVTGDFATSSSGDAFGLTTINSRFYLPRTYVSGAPLFGTSTLASHTYDSLGLTPGTYVFSLNNGPGGETITVIIPSPGGGAAAMLGLGGVLAMRRRRTLC